VNCGELSSRPIRHPSPYSVIFTRICSAPMLGIGKTNPFFRPYWCSVLSNTPTPVKLIFEYHEADERKNGTKQVVAVLGVEAEDLCDGNQCRQQGSTGR